MNKQYCQHQGYTIEHNPKPYVAGHDWDAYKPGEEEQGFTAPSRDAAIDMIDILMIESEADGEINKRTDLSLTTITLKYGYAGNNHYGWWASLGWIDSKFAETGSVEGEIRTRYGEATIDDAIRAVLEVALTFGIEPGKLGIGLFYTNDGDDDQYPPPDDWKKMVVEAAKRHNMESYK